MAFPDSLVFLAPQAPQDLQALAETSHLNCLTAMTRNPLVVACPCPALWAQLVPAVSPALLVLLVLKVSKVLPVSLERLGLLVLWVPVVHLVHLARTEMMVKLESLDVLVNVVLPAPRVPVVCPELLACQA